MQIERAKKFWRQLFQAIAGAGSNSKITLNNPGVQFNLACKAGKYDSLNDGDFEALKSEIAEESALYHNKSSASAETLLIRAIRNTPLMSTEVERIIRVLARASESVCYTDILSPKEQHTDLPAPLSPQELYNMLSEHVYGQDEAKRALSMLAYHHLNGHASSLLIAGPTGSGKTALIEALSQIPNMDVRILDGSRLGPDSYRSSVHLSDALPPEDSENCVLVIDEFDKCATETHIGANGTNYSQMTINQILLLLEHRLMTFSPNGMSDQAYVIDTSKISVILLGAFENLMKGLDAHSGGIGFGAETHKTHDYSNTKLTAEDFINAGIRREIMGRINDVAFLNPMTTEDFRRILDTPELSPVTRIAEEYHINLTVSDALKDQLAHQAYESKLGCRSVYSEVKRRLNIMMFNDCTQSCYHLDTGIPAPTVTRSPALAFAYAEE